MRVTVLRFGLRSEQRRARKEIGEAKDKIPENGHGQLVGGDSRTKHGCHHQWMWG